MNYVILDFEVFKYDQLLGAIVVNENEEKYFQTWNQEEMIEFYQNHKKDLWVGHNNIGYDNVILGYVLRGEKDLYQKSKGIVEGWLKRKSFLPIMTYDTMKGFYSLKATELVVGKNISETPIDFDIDRPLTPEEKKLIEKYNRDDLDQTKYNFVARFDDFALRLDLIKEFNLSVDSLNLSEARLAATILKAKKIPDIENLKVSTVLPPNLRIKNQALIDFYLNEDFKKKKTLKFSVCGCEQTVASGGIHGAIKKVQVDKAFYFDVSGYYNLIMLNFNLLPRTMPEESKELYKFMYHEQLRLKKINPRKRAVYKIILLAVFGGMLRSDTDFYDPGNGSLICITGELFLVDLLEKLEGLGICIQSNTDGVIFKPYDWSKKDEVIKIVEEWEKRTGFVIKKEMIYNLWQRDVNNYCFDNDGTPVVRGEIVNNYGKAENPVRNEAWQAKEPEIIARGIVDYLLYNVLPEKTVEINKENLLLFQYVCKTMSFDYSCYEKIKDNEVIREKIQNINRAFASSEKEYVGTIVKYKKEGEKVKKQRMQSLAPNVFVYNGDIRSQEVIDKLVPKIDYQYYIDRIYERCGEFIE